MCVLHRALYSEYLLYMRDYQKIVSLIVPNSVCPLALDC